MKFKNGERVTFKNFLNHGFGSVPALTKEHDLIIINPKEDDEFIISESSVMPIYDDDFSPIYPIVPANKSHCKKIYVSEDTLTKVEEDMGGNNLYDLIDIKIIIM